MSKFKCVVCNIKQEHNNFSLNNHVCDSCMAENSPIEDINLIHTIKYEQYGRKWEYTFSCYKSACGYAKTLNDKGFYNFTLTSKEK